MMKLFATEKFLDGAWKPTAFHKVSNFRELHASMLTLVYLPTFRIRRVRTAQEAHQIIKTHHPSTSDVRNTDQIEWTD